MRKVRRSSSFVVAERSPPLDDDLEAAMFEEARERLAVAGFVAYEVSNFARPGDRVAPQPELLDGGAYLGIGAGAHSARALRHESAAMVERKRPETYITRALADGVAVATKSSLEARTAAGEFVFLHLRTARVSPSGASRPLRNRPRGDLPRDPPPARRRPARATSRPATSR